jgi:hypothetical protein
MSKAIKPIYQSSLYAIIRKGYTFAVVLASDWTKTQYTGQKLFCLEWVAENDIQSA